MPSALSGIPIVVGDYNAELNIATTYDDEENERLAQSGEASDSIGRGIASWMITNLIVADDGTVHGMLEATSKHEQSLDIHGDVLFLQVRGHQSSSQEDTFSEAWSEVIPIVAKTSTDQSAVFNLQSTFRTPSFSTVEKQPYTVVYVDFSWVRVYKKGTETYCQVIIGGGEDQTSARTSFNRRTGRLAGSFLYHAPLPETAFLPIGGFDYLTWIRKNVLEKG